MTISTQTYIYQRLLKIARCTSILFTSALLNCSCARIMAPEGGPKDTTPPRLTKVYPTQESTDFKDKVIKLYFDKAIEAKDIYNELVVTPKLQKLEKKPSYTYNVRGNTLKLTLAVPLEEQTTYTFNFNDTVRDITEGNIAEDTKLTFSTGDHIDAMYVTGQVLHLMTYKPASKVLVTLHKANGEDLNILNSPPDYLVKADVEGKFKIDHVKQGKYHISASTSKENQLIADPGVDEYGFLKTPIDLTTIPAENVILPILEADVRAFKLQGQKPQDQYFELRFSKPVLDYTLTLAKQYKRFRKSSTLYSHLVENKQVIRVYNTLGLLEEDSLEAHLTAKDALGTVIEENITVQFRETRKQNNPASYTFEPAAGTAIRSNFVGIMTVNKPIKEVITEQLSFVFNGQDKVHINAEDLQFNAQRDVITIKKKLDPSVLVPQRNKGSEEGVVLQMAEGAFVTVEGDSSKAMRYAYTLRNAKEYGKISGTVTTEAPGFIVQLLDTNYKVVAEIRNEHNYQFQEVAPGSYKLRVLVLKAQDAEWSFGNIHERQEPDPVVFYPADVAMIANWEVEGIDFGF